MATLARRALKTLFFVVLFLLSVRYVYGPLSFIPAWSDNYVFVITDFLGIRDVDLFDALLAIAAGLILATVAYIALGRLYRLYRTARYH